MFVTFMEEHYQQVHGTAMGSPGSVVLADMVMETVEQRALETFPTRPCFWKRHVNDTLTAVRRNQVDEFHLHLNSIEQTITFTVETEHNNQIPFLDVPLHKEDDGTYSDICTSKTNKYRQIFTLSLQPP